MPTCCVPPSVILSIRNVVISYVRHTIRYIKTFFFIFFFFFILFLICDTEFETICSNGILITSVGTSRRICQFIILGCKRNCLCATLIRLEKLYEQYNGGLPKPANLHCIAYRVCIFLKVDIKVTYKLNAE